MNKTSYSPPSSTSPHFQKSLETAFQWTWGQKRLNSVRMEIASFLGKFCDVVAHASRETLLDTQTALRNVQRHSPLWEILPKLPPALLMQKICVDLKCSSVPQETQTNSFRVSKGLDCPLFNPPAPARKNRETSGPEAVFWFLQYRQSK